MDAIGFTDEVRRRNNGERATFRQLYVLLRLGAKPSAIRMLTPAEAAGEIDRLIDERRSREAG